MTKCNNPSDCGDASRSLFSHISSNTLLAPTQSLVTQQRCNATFLHRALSPSLDSPSTSSATIASIIDETSYVFPAFDPT